VGEVAGAGAHPHLEAIGLGDERQQSQPSRADPGVLGVHGGHQPILVFEPHPEPHGRTQ
jgi:hypothetical protein